MEKDNKIIIGIIILIIGVIGNKLILCLPNTGIYNNVPVWLIRFCIVTSTITGIFGVVYILLNYMDFKK